MVRPIEGEKLKKRDPVCEMTVGEGVCLSVDGYPQYGFCSEHCRDAFLDEPTQYNGEAVGNDAMSERAVGERDDVPAH